LRHLGRPAVESFPGFYLAQFAAYGTQTGAYASIHRTVFGHRAAEFIGDPTYRLVLATRIRTAEGVYRVVRRAGLHPMVPLGIGFRAPDRIRLSRRRLLKTLAGRHTAVRRS
jgi:hypothetical protein